MRLGATTIQAMGLGRGPGGRVGASLCLGVGLGLGLGMYVATTPQALAANTEREAYFGETHVHTSWSLDAFAIGNTLTSPGDAYKYFKLVRVDVDAEQHEPSP
jgi:hypothetical protein